LYRRIDTRTEAGGGGLEAGSREIDNSGTYWLLIDKRGRIIIETASWNVRRV
jgi:hypothetical protein